MSALPCAPSWRGETGLYLLDITLRPVVIDEEARFTALLEAHHSLGAVAKIGHTLWYVATWQGLWLALLVISATAWNCAARDRWIGWERRYQAGMPKRVGVRPLIADARPRLAHPVLDPRYHPGAPKLMLRAAQRRSLPALFAEVPDPRRAQGRRHPLPVALAIAAGAQDLGHAARTRFRYRYRHGGYEAPSRTRLRDVLTRVDPEALDWVLQGWNAQMTSNDEGLALDGKAMRNALDARGDQTQILSGVGHQTQRGHTPKKSAPCPSTAAMN